MVLPYSDRVSRVPPYSRTYKLFTATGLSPCIAEFPNSFAFLPISHWPSPRSLATTNGVSVDFFSSGYLDVSVPQVRLTNLCIQLEITTEVVGLPHSEIVGSKLIRSSPTLIAAYHVLHRLPEPRHPPYALIILRYWFTCRLQTTPKRHL
jgi:hypothetical protein